MLTLYNNLFQFFHVNDLYMWSVNGNICVCIQLLKTCPDHVQLKPVPSMGGKVGGSTLPHVLTFLRQWLGFDIIYPGPLTTLAPWWLPLNRDHHPIISFAGVGDSTLIDGGLTKRPVLLPARAYLSVIYGQVVIHVTQKYRKKSLKAIEKIIFLVCHLLN